MKKVQISDATRKEVDELLANITLPMGKAARVLSKSFGADAKLNRFLTGKIDNGYSFFTDAKRRENILAVCETGFGYSGVPMKKALIVKILEGTIDSEVENKRKELTRGIELNDEQKEQLVKKLGEYGRFLRNDLQKAVGEIALHFGVTEEVEAKIEANEPVPAP